MMNRCIFLVLICLALTGPAVVADSSRLERAILGDWHYQKTKSAANIDCLSSYLKDKTYKVTMTIKFLSTVSTVKLEGEWVVDGEDVKVTVKKSTNKLLFPEGKIFHMEKVKMTGNEMTYTHDGEEEKETRPVNTKEAANARP